MTLKNILTTSLLLAALSLSGWSIFLANQSRLLNPAAHDVTKPDAWMEDISITIMSKQGNPALKLESPKLIHYAQNDRTDVVFPHVTVYRQSPEPWYINSDHAKAIQGIEQIQFWDNVIINHPADEANPKTTMQTTALTVFPDKQIAETDRAITITQPETIVHAVGMLANFENGTVKLLSEARGEYVPSS